MEFDALDGWWRLPANDRVEFGRLSAGRSGPWTLDVYGSLEDDRTESRTTFWATDELATAPVIHGHLLQGAPRPRFVTLLGCRQQSANRTIGGAVHGERTERWTFEEVVTGHENVSEDERVVEISVRLSNLLEWSRRRPPRVDWSDDAASVAVASVNLGSAQVPGATITLLLDHGATASESEATLRHRAMFRVNPDDPVSFRSAMSDFALPLRALLSFLTLGHVDVESLEVKLERHQNDQRRTCFDYRTRLQRPFEEPKRPRPHEMLATWPDLADMEVQGLIGGWFELHQQVEKTITLLLLPHHAVYLYTDDHLITAFVAMEAYHKTGIGGTALKPEEFQKRVDAVVVAAPEAYRTWVEDMLNGRNQKGQRKKLTEIVERSGCTGAAILAAAPGFVNLAIKNRQTVAHPGPTGGEPGAIYLALSYGLRWVLRHCLLVDLGLSPERAAELVSANKVFGDERALLQRWTTDS